MRSIGVYFMISKELRSNLKPATFKRIGYFGLLIILLSFMSFSIIEVTDTEKVETYFEN